MGSIWGVLLQTATVSLIAGLLLIVKWVMADKLSPKWQYGVWSVLALRILIPVRMDREIFGSLPLWTETIKGRVEYGLNSVYSGEYVPISGGTVVPLITKVPVSVTDWLYVIYGAGVVFTLLRYGYLYWRMRSLLRKSETVSAEMKAVIREICRKHKLSSCTAVAVRGLPSPFISRVLHPVLAVPAGEPVDEKVILHELLHLRTGDLVQSVFWCMLKSLHWFNPFLRYVFDWIGNDMESLCDYRVLERLEGEERRQYGELLLQMVNERFARVPGTTAVSNGGKHIARRIEAIVRFKKYPQGMMIVALCSVVILLIPSLVGFAASYEGENYRPSGELDMPEAMAMARINRCTTKAAALDTYAKGLIFENGIYVAMASPMDRHAELETQMRHYREVYGWVAYHLEASDGLEYVDALSQYRVYNLTDCGDGVYEALLGIEVRRLPDESGNGYLKDEEGNVIEEGAVLIPVRLRQDNGWIVEECGERQMIDISGKSLWEMVPPVVVMAGKGETGAVSVTVTVAYNVTNIMPESPKTTITIGTKNLQNAVDADVQFDQVWEYHRMSYDSNVRTIEEGPFLGMAFCVAEPKTPEERVVFSETVSIVDGSGNLGMVESGSHHYDGASRTYIPGWSGWLYGAGGSTVVPGSDELVKLPKEYQAAVYWDGVLKEIIDIEREIE